MCPSFVLRYVVGINMESNLANALRNQTTLKLLNEQNSHSVDDARKYVFAILRKRSGRDSSGEIAPYVASLIRGGFGGALLDTSIDKMSTGSDRLVIDVMYAQPFQRVDLGATQFSGFRIPMALDEKDRIAELLPIPAISRISGEACQGLFEENGAISSNDARKVLRDACRRTLIAADAARRRSRLIPASFMTLANDGAFRGKLMRKKQGDRPVGICEIESFESLREIGPRERILSAWNGLDASPDPTTAAQHLYDYLRVIAHEDKQKATRAGGLAAEQSGASRANSGRDAQDA